MSSMSEAKPALPRGRWIQMSAGRALHRWLATVVRLIGAEVSTRRSIRELAYMSEYELRDFGLSRGDVERVVRHGRF
jgi:uncharacterized protein YjiS (DUF1127 family)